MALHTHEWVEDERRIERCADADCLAWRPPTRHEHEQAPLQPPRRLSLSERRERRARAERER